MAGNISCPNCQQSYPSQYAFCPHCGTGSASVTGFLLTHTLLAQRYRILKAIAQGGMGAVYQAEDTTFSNRLVAVKEMSQKGLSQQEIVVAAQQFKQEAHLLAALQNPHLPSIYDHFSEANRWYLVMSFIQGETLQAYIDRVPGHVLAVPEVVALGLQLCNVLEYLHTCQPAIIFRDLKPSNIMRSPAGYLYLIDFGIARHFKPGQTSDTRVFGTPGYAPPEQWGQTAHTTPRSDIYSLGAILHQLLSGHNPAMSPFHFPPLSVQAIPGALIVLIQQMLEIAENNRPDNIVLVRTQLQVIARQGAGIPNLVSPIAPTQPANPQGRQALPAAPTQFSPLPQLLTLPMVSKKNATPQEIAQAALSKNNPYAPWGELKVDGSAQKLFSESFLSKGFFRKRPANDFSERQITYVGGACTLKLGHHGYHSPPQTEPPIFACFYEGANNKFTDFAFQAEVSFIESGEAGILFRATDRGNKYYYFSAMNYTYDYDSTSDCYVFIFHYALDLIESQKNLRLASGEMHIQRKDQHDSPSPVLLGVVAQGEIIDIYFNLQHLNRVEDHNCTQGTIGIAVGTAPSNGASFEPCYEARFNKAKLWIK